MNHRPGIDKEERKRMGDIRLRRLFSIVPCAGAALLINACSISAPVFGLVGDSNDPFQGMATGYMDRTGTITMTNRTGVICTGQFAYTGAKTGVGSVSCNDGKAGQVQFQGLGGASGFGYGLTNSGKPIRFTYGLSAAESRRYLQPPVGAKAPDGSQDASGNIPSAGAAAASGTGFFVSPLGHVLTNHHVVDRCERVTVRLPQGPTVQAVAAASDRANDLALLATGKTPSGVAAFREGPPVRQGDSVVTFGFPLSGALSSQGNLTTGTVSALAGLRDDTRFIQITAPVQPGNSGGPLIDAGGAIVGVVRSKLDALRVAGVTGDVPQNVNFAIKGAIARSFLDSQGIQPTNESAMRPMTVADIGVQAKAYTVAIECLRSE